MFGDPSMQHDPRLEVEPPEDVKDSLTTDERKAAERAYVISAFDYAEAPVGSRDWTLFWSGWQKRAELSAPATPAKVEAGPRPDCPQCGGSGAYYGTSPVCCGRPRGDGECCGIPEPEVVQCACETAQPAKVEDDVARDAERYRYLRNRRASDVLEGAGTAAGVWIDCEDDSGTLVLLTGPDADIAIDAAMLSASKGGAK